MAKGDSTKALNQLNSQSGLSQNQLTNTFNNQLPQNQALQNRYNMGADQSEQQYGQQYQGYNDLFNQLNPAYSNLFNQISQGYGNLTNQAQNAFGPQRDIFSQFAQTGGYSPQDIQDIRARAIAPTRAVYENAQSNIDRQRALSNGNSPNYTAATAKLSRDLSQGISDANVNANASIADSIRQGKLAGASGLNQVDTSQLGLLAGILGSQGGNLSNILGGQSNALNTTLGGQRSLYGTAPGMTSMYGTQLGQSNAQMNDLQQLQQQLSQMIINGQLGVAQVPSNYQQALGNIGGTLGLGGQIFGMASGLGGGGTLPSTSIPAVSPYGQLPAGGTGRGLGSY